MQYCEGTVASLQASLSALADSGTRAEMASMRGRARRLLDVAGSAAAHAGLFREVLMAEMPPQLSVVVCTHNRPDDLERGLDALARLDDNHR